MDAKGIAKLVGCVMLCQLAGAIGSVFTTHALPVWYASLNKPWFTPPNWVFAPVWLVLYTLMGVALYLVWEKYERAKGKRGGEQKAIAKEGIAAFLVQLEFNVLWSIVFFGAKFPFAAFVIVVMMWIVMAYTISKFYKVSKAAVYLLVPYIAWVTFAALLNLFIVVMN